MITKSENRLFLSKWDSAVPPPGSLDLTGRANIPGWVSWAKSGSL